MVTSRIRLAALITLLLLVGLAWLARPQERPVTRAEQDAIDRADARVADRELAKHPMKPLVAVPITKAAPCFKRAGFAIDRRTRTTLTVRRADVPRSTIVFYPSFRDTLTADPPTPPGAPYRWIAVNNTRIHEPRNWYGRTTEPARRAFYACIDPVDAKR